MPCPTCGGFPVGGFMATRVAARAAETVPRSCTTAHLASFGLAALPANAPI